MSLRRVRYVLLFLFFGGLSLLGCVPGQPSDVVSEAEGGRATGDYLFCFWNAQDLFDDRLDGHKHDPDRTFDIWFSSDEAARKRKLKNLCDVLLGMNGKRGPDVLALAEVESYWAAELLQKALNERLRDKRDHYATAIYKDARGARNISCALITRLKVDGDRTQLLGKRQRILEAHVKAEGKQLVVIASHWGSRLKDKGTSRSHYAEQIYGRFKAMYLANPKVAFLVCGDFNDDPTDVSVTDHLHASGDLAKVKASGRPDPLLFNLFAKYAGLKDQGTHYYRGKAHVFDQIVVSPGMLPGGGAAWTVDPSSARVVKQMADKRGHPNRFGEKEGPALDERGASDHFPVTVRLKVRP